MTIAPYEIEKCKKMTQEQNLNLTNLVNPKYKKRLLEDFLSADEREDIKREIIKDTVTKFARILGVGFDGSSKPLTKEEIVRRMIKHKIVNNLEEGLKTINPYLTSEKPIYAFESLHKDRIGYPKLLAFNPVVNESTEEIKYRITYSKLQHPLTNLEPLKLNIYIRV